MNEKIDQSQINETAWRACDTFRGVVDPSEYKNYILVFLFLKYLSDVWKDRVAQYRQEYKGVEERVQRRLSRERFVLPKGCDFDSIYAKRNESNIGEIINIALEAIEEDNKAKLEGVFRDVDFNSEKLGETKDRNKRLKHLIEDFANPTLDLRPSRVGNLDVIGNTYEYLIGRFASDAGKKGGEFYTPPEVAELMAELLAPVKGDRICDPTCGSGSLLIKVGQEVHGDDFALFGQESNGSTWALCRMNMFLHGMDAARIEWGDTINNPKLIENDSLMKFEVVVANPPFSLDKWGAEAAAADRYNRFHRGVPPKSKGDYAFITHMIESMAAVDGRMAVVAPHGVLFRGGGEGRIRKALIEENLLDAVIGLPANLFFGTGIPATILVFKRGRTHTDVVFIDASQGFDQGKNQNRLRGEDIAKIVGNYRTYATSEKYSYRATRAEIEANDFNLNIPRYVDTFEPEEEIDLAAVKQEIEQLENELAVVRSEKDRYLKELGL